MNRKIINKKYNATVLGRFRSLRQSAKRRGLKLHISREEYKGIMDDAICFYCKDLLDLSIGTGYCLDRINNSKGYYLNNVVVCCNNCNNIKSNSLTFEETIFVIRALKMFRKKLIKRK